MQYRENMQGDNNTLVNEYGENTQKYLSLLLHNTVLASGKGDKQLVSNKLLGGQIVSHCFKFWCSFFKHSILFFTFTSIPFQ